MQPQNKGNKLATPLGGKFNCYLVPAAYPVGMSKHLKILALEPYYGGSHKAFLDGWIARSVHDWTLLSQPWPQKSTGSTPKNAEDESNVCEVLCRRELSAILEGSGWAINARMRLTRKQGKAFTQRPRSPKGAKEVCIPCVGEYWSQ